MSVSQDKTPQQRAEERAARFLANPALVAFEASGRRWLPSAHLRLLCRKLVDVAAGRCRRLIVEMPPRHGKSETVSRWFPAWYLRLYPDRRIMLSSYEANYAAHWGEMAKISWRDMGPLFGGVSPLMRERSDWWVIQGHGGGMVTAGIGGALTGKGANIGIIDDPVKNAEQAFSKAWREQCWHWYVSTFLTRLEPGGAVILMQTRWHEDDLAGRIQKREPGEWEVLSLPAIAETRDAMGRAPGAALWPARFDLASLEQRKREMGERWFSALYQQRPLPAESAVDRAWFRIVDALPCAATQRTRAWDLAATAKKQADYLCGAKLYRCGAVWVIADIVRRQIGPAHVTPLLRTVAEQDGTGTHVVVEQEPAASGKIAAHNITSALSGFSVRSVNPAGDKLLRATPFLDQCRAGNVVLLRAAWNDVFLDEVSVFPNGEHDDVVDACAHAFNSLCSNAGVQLSF